MKAPIQSPLTAITLVLLAVSATLMAAPPQREGDPDVFGANPETAQQGEFKTITISGENFAPGATVRFLVGGTKDASQIEVLATTFVSDETLEASIHVLDTATVSGYDIEVRVSGRKGKGTTMFSVQAKADNVLNCAPFIDPAYDPLVDPFDTEGMSTGTCTCEFSLNAENNDSGTPPGFIYNMIADCTTSQTLTIPQFGNIRSLGAVQGSGSDRKTLTAVGTFTGEAVIENKGHRATARDFNIVIGSDVLAGCDAGIKTALRFELDENSADPTIPDPYYIHTRWSIGDVWISTEDQPLCNGMEVRRTPGYGEGDEQTWDATYDAYDARIFIGGGWIEAGSYENYGVIFEGFRWKSDAINPPEVFGIRIDPPAASSVAPVGILTGGITSSDPSSPVAAHVDETVITMTSRTGATGILAYGASTGQIESDFSIGKNVISGTAYGILVDDRVDEVNFSGNMLTGDGSEGQVGICSEASTTSTRGKPNVWSGFEADEEIRYDPCMP
jgi:hypothetical protein